MDDRWQRLAVSLDLPADAFGDTLATDGMLHAARRAMTAKSDLEKLTRAVHYLRQVSFADDDVMDRLEIHRQSCKHRIAAFPRSDRRRLDAYWLADKIAMTFTAHGRPLTYGIAADGTTPSTPFCRAVRDAFEMFEVEGGWRGPARATWKTQG